MFQFAFNITNYGTTDIVVTITLSNSGQDVTTTHHFGALQPAVNFINDLNAVYEKYTDM